MQPRSRAVVLQGLLFAFGLLFGLVALVNWFVPEQPRTTRVVQMPGKSQVTEVTEPQSQPKDNVEPGIKNTRSTKTTTAASAPSLTRTTEPAGTRRSEAITLALLGISSISLLAAVFFGRIASFKFPGGEIVLAATHTLDSLQEAVTDLSARATNAEESLSQLSEALVLVAEGLARGPRPGP